MNNQLMCSKCNTKMVQGFNKKTKRFYYYCPMKCDISITAHPDGSPIGIPVGREVRELRTLAHQLANRIWNYKNTHQRRQMYTWLEKNSMSGHFGMMDEKELIKIIDKLQRIIKRFKF